MHMVNNRNFAPLHETLLFPETLLHYVAPLCFHGTQQKFDSLKCFEQCSNQQWEPLLHCILGENR